MVNHKRVAVVLAIGLVAVLMTSASTRLFAQPTLPSQIQAEENKVNTALHSAQDRFADDFNGIYNQIHH